MIYPDDYKCLVCRFRYYGCKNRKNTRMLSCRYYERRKVCEKKMASLPLARCFFGVCPRFGLLLNI